MNGALEGRTADLVGDDIGRSDMICTFLIDLVITFENLNRIVL